MPTIEILLFLSLGINRSELKAHLYIVQNLEPEEIKFQLPVRFHDMEQN
jgi:hypothetical protein